MDGTIKDILDAFAAEFETEEHTDTADDEKLIIMDENQEVIGVTKHLTYGHFRRLRKQLRAGGGER
jgi:hypothetical protein